MRSCHGSSISSRNVPALLLALGIAGSTWAQKEDPAENWPRDIVAPKGTITIYQPQLETFEGDQLTARAAVSVLPTGSTEPVFGAVWMSAHVATDRDTRIVTVLDIDVTKVVFPNATEDKRKRLEDLLEKHVPSWKLEISLDRLLTSLDLVEKENESAEALKNDTPEIIVSMRPAVLLVLDGDPELRKVDNTDLMVVVNTPYFVVLDPKSKGYYFFTGTTWMMATDLMGKWKEIMSAPAPVVTYAKKEGVLPEEKIKPSSQRAPQIIVKTEPAELIVIEGKATFKTIAGTQLLYTSNTTSDVIMDIGSQQSFVLLSGRWYSAQKLEGPWEYVASDKLPPEFQKIPPDSDKAYLLASVAGTDEAREAVLESQVPQTTQIQRTATINVQFDGLPKWAHIENSNMDYAVNTGNDVLRIDGRYYCCFEGAWYESTKPHGPYIVCVEVPAVVYTIPPEYPVYRVRYVYVYRATPTVVYVGYLPGYTGCYVYGGTVVYGTGYWYRGYYGRSVRVVYARPRTWGFAVAYNPWRGAWGFRVGYGYYGGAVVVRGGWWGARGYHRYRAREYYRDRVDDRWDHRENIYNDRRDRAEKRYDNRTDLASQRAGNRGDRATARADNRAGTAANRAGQAQARPGNRPGQRPAQAQTSRRTNNVYADRNGNVHRRTNEGWQQRTQNGWSKTQPSANNRTARSTSNRSTTNRSTANRTTRSTSNRSSLNRAHHSRQRGATRTSTYRGGSRGGARRGGGRRR